MQLPPVGRVLMPQVSAVFRRKKRGGRAGAIRTRGLLVPNRRLRPTVFNSILTRDSVTAASLNSLVVGSAGVPRSQWWSRVQSTQCQVSRANLRLNLGGALAYLG